MGQDAACSHHSADCSSRAVLTKKKKKKSLRKNCVAHPISQASVRDLSRWSSLQAPFGCVSLLASHPGCSAQLLLWAARTWLREPRGVVLSCPLHPMATVRGCQEKPQLVTLEPGHPEPQVASPCCGLQGRSKHNTELSQCSGPVSWHEGLTSSIQASHAK